MPRHGLCKRSQQSLPAVGADSPQLGLEALGDASWPDCSRSRLLRQPQEGVRRRGLWPHTPVPWKVPTTLQCHQSPGLRGVGDHPQVLREGGSWGGGCYTLMGEEQWCHRPPASPDAGGMWAGSSGDAGRECWGCRQGVLGMRGDAEGTPGVAGQGGTTASHGIAAARRCLPGEGGQVGEPCLL